MKILFVSLFLPHPRAGHAGGRYVFELVRRLSARHEITLATRLEEDELDRLEDLRPFCAAIHPYPYRTTARRGTLDKLSLIGNYLGFSRFADRLVRRGGFDLVQVEWVETGILIRRGKTPLVLDAHDVITKPAERSFLRARGGARLVARIKLFLLRRLELVIMRKFDRIVTLSDFDREYLRRLWPAAPAVTVPIPAGMDLTPRTFPRAAATLLFLASFKYRPGNTAAALWFYREVFPLVRERVPGVRFIVAGNGPPEELRALAADPGVEVTGFVEDLDRCYKEAAVFVAPILTGGGIIVKVLDALAAGTPVVTTTYGNEGVGGMPGRDLLVADDPATFADAVVRLLTDADCASRLGASGRAFVTERYGVDMVLARLEAVYAGLLERETEQGGGEKASPPDRSNGSRW